MARTNYSNLMAETATLQKDLQNPAQSGVYRNPDYVAGGSLGFEALNDVTRDTHVSALFDKQAQSITSYAMSVTPGGDAPIDIDAATFTKDMLTKLDFDKVTVNFLRARLLGFSVGEVMFKVIDNKLTVTKIIPRASRRFVFDQELNLRLRTPANMWPGELMPKNKFLVYTHGGQDNNPYGEGLASKLLALVRIKRELLVRATEYSERIANGTALATVEGAKGAELNEALQAASDLVRSGVAAVSKGVDIKLMDPNGSGGPLFNNLIELINDEMSKCVLGETDSMTSSPYKSAGVIEATHNGINLEQARSLSEAICAVINNDLVAWLIEYNFPGAKPPIVGRLIGQNEQFMEQVKKDHLVAMLGVKFDIGYLRKTYGDHLTEAPENARVPTAIAGMIG